jgi:hypothetical protein
MKARRRTTLILDLGISWEVCGQLHGSTSLPPRNNSCTHEIGGRMETTAGLDTLEIRRISLSLSGFEPRHPDDIPGPLTGVQYTGQTSVPSLHCHEGVSTHATPSGWSVVSPQFRNKKQKLFMKVTTKFVLSLHTADLTKYTQETFGKSAYMK